jgi:hypothetical protein
VRPTAETDAGSEHHATREIAANPNADSDRRRLRPHSPATDADSRETRVLTVTLIGDAYSDTSSPGPEANVTTCPDCGAKVDTVALKKRMDADTKQGMKQRDDALFYNQLEVASPRGEDRAKNRRASDEAQGGLNRTAAEWQARRDTLNAERAKSKGRK